MAGKTPRTPASPRRGRRTGTGDGAWLREVFERAGDAFLVVDAEDRHLVAANPAFCRSYGYAPAELPGLTLAALAGLNQPDSLPPDVVDLELRADGTPRPGTDLQVRHRDGSVSYADVRWSAVEVAGRPCLLGLFRDVTGRRQAEELLRQSEAAYRSATELLSDYVFRIGIAPDGRAKLEWVSGNFERITGRRLDELAGPEQWLHTAQAADKARLMNAFYELVNGGEPTATELGTLVLRDGVETRRWVEVHARPEVDAATGRVASIVGAVRDVSARKLAEAEAQKLALVVKHSGELVNLVTPDTRMIFLNDAGARMLGIEPEHVGRHRIGDVIADACRDRVQSELLPALRERGSWEGDLQYRNLQTGELTDVHAMTFVIRDPQSGAPLYFANVSRDVSELRRMEERLRQAEKLSAIGQLAGGVAHDFNNQLTVVLGCADVLRSSLGDPELRKEAERIMAAARRSAELTRNLLAFARKGQFQPVPVDPDLLLAEVAVIAERSFDKRTAIRQELGANGATVMGDPGQLQNALLNLALNARDAMPEGGELLFRSWREELGPPSGGPLPPGLRPGPHVFLSVTDQGCGMTPEVRRHLFEPFFTTKPTGKGTGMGLAAVYGTVKNHGGAIDVQTEPGRGSTFRICLPVNADGALAEPSEAPVVLDRQRGRVLVVDDEPAVGATAVVLLRALGLEPTLCYGGAEALAYYREHGAEVDLVVLDLIMPEMDGRETYRRLRELDPAVRVLLSSGYGFEGEAAELLAEGVAGFLQKPYTLAQLSAKLRLR